MTAIFTRKAALLAGLPLAMAAGALPGMAWAEDASASPSGPSSNAMVNLVRLLVAQGTITADNGNQLIAQAEREASDARAAQAAQTAQAALPAPAFGGAQASTLPPPASGTIRVPYIPETVRNQIKQELRNEVMQQAKAEGWASPSQAAPEWTRGFRLYGDIRVRSQSDLYGALNSTMVPNYAAIAAGGPLDLIRDQIPLLNTTADRWNELNLRARLGASVSIGDKLRAGIQLATGNDRSPVATSATLGGGFGKRDIYLDEAFIEARPASNIRLIAGRFENPFWSTDSLFDPDLRFDGAAAEIGLHSLLDSRDFNLKLRGGAFPLDFGGANFPNTASQKIAPAQKYLFSAQAEADFTVLDDVKVRAAVGYHDFVNLQGRPSDPCALYLGATQCSTDNTAVSFVQKGNTLSFIRRIVLDPNLPSSTVQSQPQLLGLVMDYNILDAMAQVRFPVAGDIEFTLTGDYLRNLGFKRSNVCRYGVAGQPVNNGQEVDYTGDGVPDSSGSICASTHPTKFVGGNTGYEVMASIGHPVVRNWGEWRVYAGYKYLESDAVLDGFTDDIFHLGGTNAKGYIVGAQVGTYKGVTLGARWLSSNQITGDPLAIDVFQLDMDLAF